jgi:hypothetical protein
MKLRLVDSPSLEKDFINVPKVLYRKDPVWVCPLDTDIINRFNPEHNPLFKDGEAVRWVLYDEKGNLSGRIAAFYNRKKAAAENVMAGGAGYFECINSKEAAFLLLDTAREWLESKGMKAFDAPVNFGENDSNWGLLVEGFTHPAYGMPYHFPYYKDLFEDYGFQLYFKQYSYHLDLTQTFPERFWKIAEWIGKKPDFSFRHFEFREAEKFIADMIYVYDLAWSHFKDNFTPLLAEDLRETLRKSKPILDPHMIWFAYHKDEPISFFIMLPDVNQILKKLNGKTSLINMLKFLYYRETKTMTRIRAMVAGIIPKFQNSGVESGIFWHMNEKMKHKKHYTEIELSWVGDFNPKMIALYEAVGGKRAKIHHTYRYMIDKSIPFERFMPEGLESALNRKIREKD